MKKIEAYIKPHRVEEVELALRRIKQLTGLSLTETRGCGRVGLLGRPDASTHDQPPSGLIEAIKLEVFCNDPITDQVVTAIEKAAHTGLRGDGKLYILPVEQAVRISTGERGESAV